MVKEAIWVSNGRRADKAGPGYKGIPLKNIQHMVLTIPCLNKQIMSAFKFMCMPACTPHACPPIYK